MEPFPDGCNPYLSAAERAAFAAVRVGIAGAGGLGSNCAAHLLRAGIRNLTIADFDRVAPGNLNRQFYFAAQIGMFKTEALRENLLRIDPGAAPALRCLTRKVAPENVAELFGDCGIVVEAFDAPDAKMMLIHALLALGKRVVAASGMGGWGAGNRIRTTAAGRNLYLIGDCERDVGEAGNAPASPRVGIVSAMQANTVAALILGKEP